VNQHIEGDRVIFLQYRFSFSEKLADSGNAPEMENSLEIESIKAESIKTKLDDRCSKE